MHSILVIIGVLLVLIIAVHIFFRIVKFTLSVFIFAVALIATIYVFQEYFGIDLIGIIGSHL